jgi:4a-hydroxytetrahydrobiopterin dehydratase
MGGRPQPLTEEQIADHLSRLPGWVHDGDMLTKTFKFDTYLAGVTFASAIGTIAEGLDHHPDLLIGYKRVTVSFTTHSADHKVTNKDIEAAEAIEALPYKPAF